MIGSVSAHRRANAFAEALDELPRQDGAAERSGPSADEAEQGRLLALAAGLGELPAPELDPEVKTVQRAQLVAAMENMLAEDEASAGPQMPGQRSGRHAHRASPLDKLRPRTRWSKGLAAGGLTVGVAAGAFSGVAAASSEALPGDSLYGLKRSMEDLKLGFAEDDRDRGEIYLAHASTRMQEARRLMERARSGDLDHESVSEVRRALSGMRHDAAEGHRLLSSAYEHDGALGPIQTLQSFSRSQQTSWSSFKDRLPPQLTDVRDQVTSVFEAIDEQVAPLRSLLPAPSGSAGDDGAAESAAGSSGPAGSQRSSEQPHSPESDPSGSGAGGSGEPQPSESASQDRGLIGGAGDLLDPPETAPPPSTGDGNGPGSTPQPDITLPPLLPGLLPGLGLDAEDAG